MIGIAQTWIEAAAIAAAVLLIPIYLGFIHASAAAGLAYVFVGGTAMAVGEQLQFRFDVELDLGDLALWFAIIGGVGGIAYLLALLLI